MRTRLAGPWGDPLLAAVLAGLMVTGLLVVPDGDGHRSPDLVGVALLLAMAAALAVRRRWPVLVLVATVVAAVLYQGLDYPPEPGSPAPLIALYTVAATGPPRRSLLVGGVTCVIVTVTLVVSEPGS